MPFSKIWWMMPSMRAVSAPGRIGHEIVALGARDREAWVDGDEPGAVLVPASHITRQSGIEVSATLLAQKTIVSALMKSTDSWPVKKPPALEGLVGSTRT